MTEFTFSLHDNETMINHWFLNTEEVISAVSETSEWKNDNKLVAKVTVNGVEMPFAALDKFLFECYESHIKKAEERFSDLDAEVDRRLKLRLENDAKPIVEKMWELQQVLDSAGDLLKPYWDKN